jgi:hypothetical protein
MTGEPTDTQGLLERARGGDRSAFEELFQRHRRRLQKAIAMRLFSIASAQFLVGFGSISAQQDVTNAQGIVCAAISAAAEDGYSRTRSSWD